MKASELLIVGVPDAELGEETRKLLGELRPGGVILFARNLASEAQLSGLVRALKEVLPEGLLYLDAEGGRVDRLRGIVGPAPAAALLARQPSTLAFEAGRWVGFSLRAFGFDVDLAPVVDLDHGHTGNALDQRTFGASPRPVVARAGAFLRGLGAAGVGGCLKHFPGLGAARQDTHDEGAGIALTARQLERELAPFRRLGDEAGAVMASHASYPRLDLQRRPASLSPPIATDLLRGRLGFAGVLFSDDLDMHALDTWGSVAERAEAALVAGCDGLFVCHSLAEAPAAAERLSARALAPRVTEARARFALYRARLRRLAQVAPVPLAEVKRRLAELQARAAEAGATAQSPRV